MVIKRVFDITVSLLAIFLLLPLFMLVAVLVRCFLGRPVFFRQLRPGRQGKPFIILKFRTMKEAYGSDNKPLDDSRRITKFGTFLRSSSLDEIPELFNVLKGDMSLVGPRPLMLEYLDLYTDEQARRHEIRPGITGWAQVKGRNSLSWEQRFSLDVWYIDNRSMWLDLKILGLTLLKVIQREGINEKGSCTMSPFQGSNDKRG